MARISMRLSAEVETVAEEGFEAIEVTHFDQCQRGLEYLNNYVAAVSSSLLASKQNRGDVGARESYGGAPIVSERTRSRETRKSTKVPRSGHNRKSKDTSE